MRLKLYPQRIVCMTEETTETLYLLGEQERIVGISGFTVRPPRARKEKPKVSAFTSANIEAILALKPDLVLGFSDLQADIAATLIRHGISVYVFNQRSVAEILSMIAQLSGIVGAQQKGWQLIAALQKNIDDARAKAAQLPRRPRVFFEEWYDPLISGIGWVSELIAIAGGDDIFPELAREPGARQRIIADPLRVVERAPDIIIGSWCGRKFKSEKVVARPGWSEVPAVRHQQLYEVKSPLILQPGPAALSDGLAELQRIIFQWAATP
jgi:iron complex transport system substrate-binding protein